MIKTLHAGIIGAANQVGAPSQGLALLCGVLGGSGNGHIGHLRLGSAIWSAFMLVAGSDKRGGAYILPGGGRENTKSVVLERDVSVVLSLVE